MTPASQPGTAPAMPNPPQPPRTPTTAGKPVATSGDDMVCTLCGLRACWTE